MKNACLIVTLAAAIGSVVTQAWANGHGGGRSNEAAECRRGARDCFETDTGRTFPEWEPSETPVSKSDGLAKELRGLLKAGRRDRAASPEFLTALEGVLKRYEETVVALDCLPMKADFRGFGWPAGWRAVNESVWRFDDGVARQMESRANTRYVLFYEPGMEWTDYSVTFRCESESWMAPPMRSSAWLYFRYHDFDDSYELWLDGAGDITLVSNDKNKHHRYLAQVPVAPEVIRDGKPWTLNVRGNTIEVWHEGKRMLMATDNAHTSGTVGLESVHIPMNFSDVEVRP